MNRRELQKLFSDERVRSDAYSLDGGLAFDTHCIERRGETWVVYYTERGVKLAEAFFDDEESACEELKNRVLAERSNRF